MMNAEELKKIMEHAKEDSCYIRAEMELNDKGSNEIIVVGDSDAVKFCIALLIENFANSKNDGDVAKTIDDIRTIILMKQMFEEGVEE